MSVLRIDPFRSFERSRQKMASIMSDLEKGINFEYGDIKPRVDIAEDNRSIFVYVELPGIQKEQVKISINEENMLTIKGIKNNVHTENQTIHRNERQYGEFERSFILPDNLKTENISAKFENGLLEISIEKQDPPKPKEVEISIL
jgi:HSP20 family protein